MQRKRGKRRFLGLLSQDRPSLFRRRKCWRIVTTPKTSVSSASSAFHGFKVLFALIRVDSRSFAAKDFLVTIFFDVCHHDCRSLPCAPAWPDDSARLSLPGSPDS